MIILMVAKQIEDTKLPSIENFYSNLYNSECSEEDYEREQNVWNVFECKTFKNYHNNKKKLYEVIKIFYIYYLFLN